MPRCFFLLLREFFERWVAAAAAAVFLVHPVQTEPVLYVYQRSTLLARFFSLLALIASVKIGSGWRYCFCLRFRRKRIGLGRAACYWQRSARRREELAQREPQRKSRARQRESLRTLKRERDSAKPSEDDRRRSRDSTSSAVIDRRYRIGLIIGALVLAVSTLALLVYWGEQTVGIVAASNISPVRYFMAQTRVVYTYLAAVCFFRIHSH